MENEVENTQQTQPTDTEMLDWVIKNKVRVRSSEYPTYYWLEYEHNFSNDFPTPRQAIAAEMMKENK